MLTHQIAPGTYAIVDETPLSSHAGFVGWRAWVKNEPHLFITRAGGKPVTDETFAIPRNRLIEFTTPGSMSLLYYGDHALDPAVCAMRCGEACRALGIDATELYASNLLDLIEHCHEAIFYTPHYTMIQKGGHAGDAVIGDVAMRVNGTIVHEAEVRV